MTTTGNTQTSVRGSMTALVTPFRNGEVDWSRVETLVDRWLAARPPEPVYEFLRSEFRELVARHGRVYGRKIPAPKLLPVS